MNRQWSLDFCRGYNTQLSVTPKRNWTQVNRTLAASLVTVTALAFAAETSLAQVDDAWVESDQTFNELHGFEPSGLIFTLDGAALGIFQVAVQENNGDVVSYGLGGGEISFAVSAFGGSYDEPLFCFDYADEAPSVGLTLTDANGHVIADRISVGGGIEYLLASDELSMVPAPTVQCFYRGHGVGDFGLFGVAPAGDELPDELFASRFEFVEPPGSLEIVYNDEAFVNEGVITYDVSVINTGTVDFDNVKFQEVFPRNNLMFDASLNTGFWQCASSAGAVCPDGDSDDPLRFEGLSLVAGSSLTFTVTRLVRDGSAPGQLDLFAGAVAAPGPNAAFDAVHRSLIVVGEGEALAASSEPAEVGQNTIITVTALDGEGGQVPNVEVTVSDDDGLDVTPSSETTGANGQAQFTASTTDAGDYQVVFSADGLDEGVAEVTFSAGSPDQAEADTLNNDAIADGEDQVIFQVEVVDEYDNPVTGALVEVLDAGGLAELVDADAFTVNGIAEFAATSETAGGYTVVFDVEGVGSVDTTANFVAGDPDGFEFVQQPQDGTAGQPLSPVVVQVVDANGNWVDDDDDTLVEVYLRQQGVGGQDFLTASMAIGGQVGFEGLVVEEPGENYFLRIQDADGVLSSEDSESFNVSVE